MLLRWFPTLLENRSLRIVRVLRVTPLLVFFMFLFLLVLVFLRAHCLIKLLFSLLLSHHISLNSRNLILFIRLLFLFPNALLKILLLGPVCGLIVAIGYESALLEGPLSLPCWAKKIPCSACCCAFFMLPSLPLCCLLLAKESQVVQIWRLEHVAF